MRLQVEAQIRETSRVSKPIRTKDTNSVRAAAYYHSGTVSMIRVFAILSYMRYHSECTYKATILLLIIFNR